MSVKKRIDCKVISTYFGPRRVDSSGVNDTISILRKHLKYELTVPSGREMDTIIVNHQLPSYAVGRKEAERFLELLNGQKTLNGEIRVINRPWNEGIGASFASFSFAFEKFQNDYNYWLFTEDEVYLIKPDYLQEAVRQFRSDQNVSFICSVRSRPLKDQEIIYGHPPHCNGGCGITHRRYLKKIFDKYGRLPYPLLPMPKSVQQKIFAGRADAFDNVEGQHWYRKLELEGEIAFTNVFVKEGFKLADIDSADAYVEFRGAMYQKLC